MTLSSSSWREIRNADDSDEPEFLADERSLVLLLSPFFCLPLVSWSLDDDDKPSFLAKVVVT